MNKIRVAYIVIFTILITLAVFVANDRAHAYNEECEYDVWSAWLTTFCYLENIHDQNKQIIEKLDWNNCVSMYLASNPYSLPKNSSPEVVYDKVENWCGERP